MPDVIICNNWLTLVTSIISGLLAPFIKLNDFSMVIVFIDLVKHI